MKVCTTAGEALRDDVVEIALQVAEVMGYVLGNERKRPLQPRNNIFRNDVGSRVLDDDGNTEDDKAGDRSGPPAVTQKSFQQLEHLA